MPSTVITPVGNSISTPVPSPVEIDLWKRRLQTFRLWYPLWEQYGILKHDDTDSMLASFPLPDSFRDNPVALGSYPDVRTESVKIYARFRNEMISDVKLSEWLRGETVKSANCQNIQR